MARRAAAGGVVWEREPRAKPSGAAAGEGDETGGLHDRAHARHGVSPTAPPARRSDLFVAV